MTYISAAATSQVNDNNTGVVRVQLCAEVVSADGWVSRIQETVKR